MRRTAPDFARLWLRTSRLTLRPLRHDDLDQLSVLLGDADALVNWGPPLDRAGARDWIVRNLARYETDGFGRCAVELRSTGELIGDCGLIRTTVEGTDEVELGWIVGRAHWGHGFATESAAAWRDVAFATLGLKRIVSMIAEDNVASRRVAEKLGMTIERRVVWDDAPMLMYSRTRAPPCSLASARATARAPEVRGATSSEPCACRALVYA